MIQETLSLPQAAPALKAMGSGAELQIYARSHSESFCPHLSLPGLLLCPGGGYSFTSDREAEPVALEFLARGYQVFVLRYTCAPARFPLALTEAAAALRYLRENAEKYHVDPKRTACMGFSAGGHLAGSLAEFWDDPRVLGALGEPNAAVLRPDACCLCYSVVTSGEYAHRDSFTLLLGEDAAAAQVEEVSLEKRVRPDMPPVFLWHTADDAVVPVENSLLLAAALRRAGVPAELHVYPHGPHGLSLANSLTAGEGRPDLLENDAAAWPQACADWLRATLK